MKPRLPVIFLILLVLSACTTNKLQPSPQQAPSQLPTHVSMYFYSAGSMQFYEGAYDTALNLFQRASSIDPGSVRIRRQLLLSAMYHYLQQRADSLEVKKLMDQNRDLIARDQELLDTAYSFYSETEDSEGIHWTIETMLDRFPSARAHVLNFITNYNQDSIPNSALLVPALDLARNDPEELHALSQLFDMVDPPSALLAAKRLYEIDPGTDTAGWLAARIVAAGDQTAGAEYFSTLIYPQDLELMYLILDEALQTGQLQLMNQVSGQVIATKDSELSYLIALSALMSRDQQLLSTVESHYHDDVFVQQEQNYVTSLLIANSLLENETEDLGPMLDRLGSSQDLDNIVQFYILAQSSAMQDPSAPVPDSIYSDLALKLGSRFNDTTRSRYLISTVLAIPDQDSTLSLNYSLAKEELIHSFIGQDIYTRDDLSWLLTAYYQKGLMGERVALLRKGIELFPDEHAWYNDLGYTLLVQGGDREEAAALIFEALGMDPANHFYLDSIAWYYYLEGDYLHAREFITGVMEMEDMPSEIAYHIGLIHLKLNDFATATSYMVRAAEASDDPTYNDRARRALDLWGVRAE